MENLKRSDLSHQRKALLQLRLHKLEKDQVRKGQVFRGAMASLNYTAAAVIRLKITSTKAEMESLKQQIQQLSLPAPANGRPNSLVAILPYFQLFRKNVNS
ncbi:hypothetical protein CAPTEDRAFT_197763 [Capitella teleta]|uniref:Uncharacterized protein n=1 Tax=Capitella teleta TaxID=283909 RepID=R7TR71_CAPTE|nr:hypothetical protein CAPTEDRAFT_197763 [Capitella teleta]|eukprot:ELT93991.1 hypothetical protein CAPTEDRAFT_197763 [Capitella teleta]